MNTASYRRKGLLTTYSSRGRGFQSHRDEEHGSRQQAGVVLEQQLFVHILTHARKGSQDLTGNRVSLLKGHPGDTPSCNKAASPSSSQIVLCTGDQVLKHTSRWGHSQSNHYT